MSFFKKRKPSRSNSAPAQQQQFPTKSPSPSQQKQQSRPICPWSAHAPSFTQSLSPFPRHAHALSTTATVAGELFLFGGYVQSSKSVTNDLYMFSTRDFSITPMKTSGQAPNPRYGHRAAFTNTTLFIIWGGVTNRSDRNAENRCDDNSLYLLNLGTSYLSMLRFVPADRNSFHSSIATVDPCRGQWSWARRSFPPYRHVGRFQALRLRWPDRWEIF